jgi:glutathione S-transferase
MDRATLTISSKTYSAWSLRGWLLCQLAGLEVEEKHVVNDAANRAELLLLSSVLVPRLTHEGASVWDTLAIAEYLNELYPDAHMLPTDRVARAHCRSISGEIHSGFTNLRSALPMNLKAKHKSFPSSPARGPISSGSRRSGRNVWPPMGALSVRHRAYHRGRHVCAGDDTFPQLCRGPVRAEQRLLSGHRGMGADDAVGCRGFGGTGGD